MGIRDKAYQDFLDGMLLVDIAKKHNIDPATVRQWKKRHWTKKNCDNVTSRDKAKAAKRDAAKNKISNVAKNVDNKKLLVSDKNPKSTHPNVGNRHAVGNRGGKGGAENSRKFDIYSTLSEKALSPDKRDFLLNGSADRIDDMERQARMIDLKIIQLMEKIAEWEEAKDGIVLGKVNKSRGLDRGQETDLTQREAVNAFTLIDKALAHINQLTRTKNKIIRDIEELEAKRREYGMDANTRVTLVLERRG